MLDLFAGTGALGLEALSRGAAFCLFVEEDAEARALIRRNVEALGLTGVTKIFRRDATDLGPAGRNGGFALVFLDPPYGQGLAERALASAAAGGWLAPGAIAVIEERKGTALALPAGFVQLDRRAWGDTEVLFARFAAGQAESVAMPQPDRGNPSHYPVSGWVEAFTYTLAIAVLSISYVVGQQVGAHPIAFILYAMFVSAVVLLAVTGFGPDALRIMLAPQSWLVGLGIIGIEVAYYILLDYVAPAHGSLLVRLAIPLSMVAGWVLFARRPPRLAVIGTGVVFRDRAAAVRLSMPSIAPRGWRPASLGVVLDLRSFAAEFHPWNRRATTVMEKLRVTGLVVLVTSLASLALAGVVAVLDRTRASAADRHDADRCRRCCMGRPSCSPWRWAASC